MDAVKFLNHYLRFTEIHNKLSDEELTKLFNKTVGHNSYDYEKRPFLKSIKNQLKNRKINYSTIGNKNYVSYKNCVVLKRKKFYKISELKKSEVRNILLIYLQNNEHEEHNHKLKIISYSNEGIKYTLYNNPQHIIYKEAKKIL